MFTDFLIGLFIVAVIVVVTIPLWKPFIDSLDGPLDPDTLHHPHDEDIIDLDKWDEMVKNSPSSNSVYQVETIEPPKDYAPPLKKKKTRLSAYERAKIKKKVAIDRAEKKKKKNQK